MNLIMNLEVGQKHNLYKDMDDSQKLYVDVCQCFIANGHYQDNHVFYLCDEYKVLAIGNDTTKLNELAHALFPDMNERIEKARIALR